MSKKNIFLILALLLVSFLTYFNSLHNAFMMDDASHFVSNYNTHNIKNLFSVFTSSKGSVIETGATHFRPLHSIIIVINFVLFQYNSFGYHVLNCILFFIFCVFIFFFSLDLTKDFWVSAVTAVLFCVHPINGMLVNYITANGLIVQLIFMMASLGLVQRSIVSSSVTFVKCGLLGLAGFLYLLSCLCHETAYFLPFYAAALCLVVHRLSIRQTIKYCFVLFLVLGLILLFRVKYFDVGGSLWQTYQSMGINPGQYFASVSKVWFWYLGQLLYPQGVVLIWATPAVVSGMVWVWIAALMLFWGGIIFAILKLIRDQKNVFGFFVLLLTLGFVPTFLAAMLFRDIGIVMEPHWVYFNTIGFFVVAAWLLVRLTKKVSKILTFGLIASIVFALLSQTWVMNSIWGDEIKYCDFWRSNILVRNFYLIDFFQATAYFKKKFYSKSRPLFEKSLADLPYQWKSLVNLGLIELNEKKFDVAITYFKKAIDLEPNKAAIYTNLGVAYRELGKNDQARLAFERAFDLDPNEMATVEDLALCYVKEKNFKAAEKLYEKALEIEPAEEGLKLNLLKLYYNEKNIEKFKSYSEQLIKEVNDKNNLVSAGDVCALANQVMLAVDFYTKAVKVDPAYALVYVEFGKLLGNMGRFDDALMTVRMGLKMNPNHSQLLQLMREIRQWQAESKIHNK
ncbi:MAG: tetratricopeptide repeat protein [Candidatus Omnitrophica bacterium]|nr:tetratricopeptide repeat protein [Candidatus Omnitrophota bacterium]